MRRVVLLFVCLVLVGGVASGADSLDQRGVEVGPLQYYMMADSPVSGPVETFVISNHPVVYPDSLSEVQLAVENNSNDATVTINIDLDLVYADGKPVEPFHLGMNRSHTLGPNEGVAFRVYFAVPTDAPLGHATFRASARIGRVTGDPNGHPANPNPMIATDSIEFEVVARSQ
jgi:hypothetical protein